MNFESWQVQTFTGVGKKVLRIEPLTGPALLIFQTSEGESYTGVTGVDAAGQGIWFPVNAVGQYSGTSLFTDTEPVIALQIESDLGWSAAIRPLSEARVWSESAITGVGNDVLQLPQPTQTFATVALRTSGDGHTGVWAYSEVDATLLFNTVGIVEEEVVLPVGSWIISVESDSPWSMARTL